ncbi:MAG: transposase [Bacteroidaceae bacterium]|nr:transposase [Bacteroidaceae bacterium]
MRIPDEVCSLVLGVSMDLSESMRTSIESCFPNLLCVVDRFHVQQEVCAGLNEIRMIAKRKERKEELKARKKTRPNSDKGSNIVRKQD